MPLGVVTAPGQRYHPTITAQAGATLARMFPGRFWMAVGSGENVNEHVTGDLWPDKRVRNERLVECVDLMRRLWAGETVSASGHVRVEQARVYAGGAEPPALFVAAITPETARWAAGWADGLVTISQPRAKLIELVDAWRSAGGDGKRLAVQVKLSSAISDDDALAQAHDQWASNVFDGRLMWNLALPEQFDEAARHVRPEDMHAHVFVASDLGAHVNALRELLDLGFDDLYLHNVGPNQIEFVEAFADAVLPALLARSNAAAR